MPKTVRTLHASICRARLPRDSATTNPERMPPAAQKSQPTLSTRLRWPRAQLQPRSQSTGGSILTQHKTEQGPGTRAPSSVWLSPSRTSPWTLHGRNGVSCSTEYRKSVRFRLRLQDIYSGVSEKKELHQADFGAVARCGIKTGMPSTIGYSLSHPEQTTFVSEKRSAAKQNGHTRSFAHCIRSAAFPGSEPFPILLSSGSWRPPRHRRAHCA